MMSLEFATLDYMYNVECIINPETTSPQPGTIYNYGLGDINSRSSPYRAVALDYLANEVRHPMLQFTFRPEAYLQQVRFSSPGIQDLAGIARALEAVGKGLRYILEWKQSQERHRADMAEKQLQRQQLAIKNAMALLKFMQGAKYPPRRIQQTLDRFVAHQQTLISLVDERQIVNVRSEHD